MTSLTQGLMLEGGGVISLVGAGGKTTLMFRLAHELAERGESVLTTTTTKILLPQPEQSSCVVVSEPGDDLMTDIKKRLEQNRHISAASRYDSGQNKLIGFPPVTIEQLWNSGCFKWVIVEADGAARRPLKAPAAHEPVIPDCAKWVIAVVGLSAVGQPLSEKWVFRAKRFSELTGHCAGRPIDAAAAAAIIRHPEGLMRGCPKDAVRIVFLNQADSSDRIAIGHRIADLLAHGQGYGFSHVIIGNCHSDPPVIGAIKL